MREELILYAQWDEERARHFIHVSEVSLWPPPVGAQVICRIDREDRELMLQWAIKRAKAGWPVERMRQACGEVRHRR